MKYIAISLLLANLAYFGYQYLQPEVAERADSRTATADSKGSIQLLSEVQPDAKTLAMSSVVENPIRQDQAEDAENLQCVGIGPFSDVFSGQNSLERLSALQVIGELRAVDVATGESDHRVLIPPAPSAEEAFRKLRELQASNVDSYVITQGEQALGISLGVFSTLEGAQALAEELESMGYESEIIDIQRQSRSYWIELSRAEFDQLEGVDWQGSEESISSRQMICTESE